MLLFILTYNRNHSLNDIGAQYLYIYFLTGIEVDCHYTQWSYRRVLNLNKLIYLKKLLYVFALDSIICYWNMNGLIKLDLFESGYVNQNVKTVKIDTQGRPRNCLYHVVYISYADGLRCQGISRHDVD